MTGHRLPVHQRWAQLPLMAVLSTAPRFWEDVFRRRLQTTTERFESNARFHETIARWLGNRFKSVCCASSTRVKTGANEYGVVHERWGYGSSHDGERYELHLCEECFFRTVAYIKQERRCHTLFADGGPDINENLGLITKHDYFGDSDH